MFIFLFIGFFLFCISLVHSYYFKGFFTTLNFFFFAFLLIFTRGECPGLYFIGLGHLPIFSSIAAVFLGLSVLYASWLIAEKITQGFCRLRERILPVVLISSIICGCFIYAVGGVLYIAGQWFFFCTYFLGAFFLITSSKFKKYDWKTVFFALPLVQSWTTRIFGEGAILFLTEFITFMLLINLLFFSDPRFDYPKTLKK